MHIVLFQGMSVDCSTSLTRLNLACSTWSRILKGLYGDLEFSLVSIFHKSLWCKWHTVPT